MSFSSIDAVLFDLGGVIFPSPFPAIEEFEVEEGFSKGTVRSVLADGDAWARLERGEISEVPFTLIDCFFFRISTLSIDICISFFFFLFFLFFSFFFFFFSFFFIFRRSFVHLLFPTTKERDVVF